MVYLIHFEHPLQHARHYMGYCNGNGDGMQELQNRMDRHRAGHGARILSVLNDKGISYYVVRVWDNANRNEERRLKNRKNAPKMCPVCNHDRAGKEKP